MKKNVMKIGIVLVVLTMVSGVFAVEQEVWFEWNQGISVAGQHPEQHFNTQTSADGSTAEGFGGWYTSINVNLLPGLSGDVSGNTIDFGLAAAAPDVFTNTSSENGNSNTYGGTHTGIADGLNWNGDYTTDGTNQNANAQYNVGFVDSDWSDKDTDDGCGAIVFDWGDVYDDSSIIELTGSYAGNEYSWFVQTTLKAGSNGYYGAEGSDEGNTAAEDAIVDNNARLAGYFGDFDYAKNSNAGESKGARKSDGDFVDTFGGTTVGAGGSDYGFITSGGIGDADYDDIIMAIGFRDLDEWDGTAFLSDITFGMSVPSETVYGSYELYGKAGVFDNLGIVNNTVVPEPATMLLLGLGGLVLRRRKR